MVINKDIRMENLKNRISNLIEENSLLMNKLKVLNTNTRYSRDRS